jgi:DNA-binding CsgD family transcriptional regulator/tetratricopeptide (TPR) repeat protein
MYEYAPTGGRSGYRPRVELLERAELLAALQQYRAGPGGAMVFVAGEAGIGKSALVRSFCAGLPPGTAVHHGSCDALATPRALGPLHDIARTDPGGLGRLLDRSGERRALFTAFLDLLSGGPSVVVVEDAHWADEATADLLLFVGRRVGPLPATVVVTYRGEEVGRDHPLRRVLGDLATAPAVSRLNVPPLTAAAVAALAEGSDRDAADLHAVTRGNPFFVTEVLGAPDHDVPTTVRDAVLGRASRLGDAARTVLDIVSLVPDRIEAGLLQQVAAAEGVGAVAAALDAGIRSGVLEVEGPAVRFRHELARRVIEGDVPRTREVALHARLLAHLVTAGPGIDPARLSYHAEAADDPDAVLLHAPAAARTATSLGAHREAAAQYARALRHAARATPAARARLWEQRALACDRADELTAALDASARAVGLWEAVGEVERAAAVLSRRSFLLWKSGRTAEAGQTAGAAVALLEPRPPGPVAGQAICALARLHLLAGNMSAAVELGSAAVTAAAHHGDVATSFLAQGVVGSALWTTDLDRAVTLLTGCLDAARGAGDEVGVGLALSNLGMGALGIRRYQLADRWLGEAVAWCSDRDLNASRDASVALQARSWLEQGRWAEATAAAAGVVAGRPQHIWAETVALTVLGRLRARSGDPDPQTPLDQAWTLARRSGGLLELWTVAAARAEAAWLGGEPDRIAELVADTHRLAVGLDDGWAAGELGHWLRVAGAAPEQSIRTAGPWALQAAARWDAAAALWRQLGCPYEAAVALAEAEDVEQLLVAFHELHRLGAWTTAEVVARRLRERGVRNLPHRPRHATLANPARLTERQVDVLALLTAGLRNSEIAARLHISPKTVDHHVSAVLAKLGVGSRREAARWARVGGFPPRSPVTGPAELGVRPAAGRARSPAAGSPLRSGPWTWPRRTG